MRTADCESEKESSPVVLGTIAGGEPPLPDDLHQTLLDFVGKSGYQDVIHWLRPPSDCMTPSALGAYKASRISFSHVLARKMIDERWGIQLRSFESDAEGDAHGIYDIVAGESRFTFAVRSFRWDGIEKVGRRADGSLRDVLGAIFVGEVNDERIKQEFQTFDARHEIDMRTDSAVAGWNPANRSSRFFDYTVECLTEGRQPDPLVLGEGGGYLLRNGGFMGSGRNGSLSYEGYPTGHPFRHPYFADLFGLYMIRQVSIDLANAVAKQRNPNAATLSPQIAKFLGVGNSSGQGMCVAMQRWPHWVSSWVLTRELSLAYAKSRKINEDTARAKKLLDLLKRASTYLELVKMQSEDFVTPPGKIAGNLRTIQLWVQDNLSSEAHEVTHWGEVAERVSETFDRETAEQFGSILIEIYPEFADSASGHLLQGTKRFRDVIPEMSVAQLQHILRGRYAWALKYNLLRKGARNRFWYHSADNGEQRRGERIVDPHEQFESFIDHIGAIQRLSSTLNAYDENVPVGEIVADFPELAFAVSRVQFLANVPFSEIRGNLIDAEFVPARLIRFMLASLGIECASPLNDQYVRGAFFQGMPLPDELEKGADPDWMYPVLPDAVPNPGRAS